MRSILLPAIVGVVLAHQALAQPVEVSIDGGSVAVTLCINSPLGGQVCDIDQSTVSGTTTVELDAYDTPTDILLHDFNLSLDETLDFVIGFGALGTITADIQNATVDYAQPGVPFGPSLLAGNAYSFVDVPTNPGGTANYSVPQGTLVCVFLQNQEVPCSDSLPLSAVGTILTEEVSGTVAVNGNELELGVNVNLTFILESESGEPLGSISMSGSLTGTGTVPSSIPGDIDGDGDVDLSDFSSFSTCFGLSAPEPPVCDEARWMASDIDGSGNVNLNDYTTFATNFGS